MNDHVNKIIIDSIQPFLLGVNMKPAQDEMERSHNHRLPGEPDRIGVFADHMLNKLKKMHPDLQWEELNDILDPAIISDYVMGMAKSEGEKFDDIVSRLGKLLICARLIPKYEEKIIEYYRVNA